jgi:hypothetical protein
MSYVFEEWYYEKQFMKLRLELGRYLSSKGMTVEEKDHIWRIVMQMLELNHK